MKYFSFNKLSSFLPAALTLFILCAFSCEKEEEAPAIVHETGTMTDVEGNVYKTIKIGNQWWMAENLKVKKYRNGNPIPHVSIESSWNNGTAGYCSWNDQNTATITYPGLLYNWNAVTDSNNIAPTGWHIPTDAEWKELEKYLGMNASFADQSGWRGTNEGDKLKIEGPQDWLQYGNVWGTNESGFTALAGGCRLFDGRWADKGLNYTGFWWTASEYTGTDAWYRYLDYKNDNIFRSACSKNYGYSIRCVKD